MPKRDAWVLALTALAVRLPVLFLSQSLLPVAAPWGPLPAWLQPWLDAQPNGWGWWGLGLGGALADALSAVLLAKLVERGRLADRLLAPKRQPESWASPGFWAGLAWAAHPVAAYLAGSAGAWQSLALLGLLSAAWNLEFSVHPAAEDRAAWGFGLAISAALWPLLVLPLGVGGLLSRRARLRFYAQALGLPLLLALPWLILKDPATVARTWQGPPSTLGLPGLVTSVWSAVGAPAGMLQPLLGLWQWPAIGALLLYPLVSLWRPVALLPGLALGAWVWVLLAPQLQGPLFLAPLGLALLVPSRLAWRLMAATLVLLVLQDHLPGLRGLQLQQADPGGAWRGTHLCWGALLLAWFFWVVVECFRLGAYARRSQRSAFLL